MKAIEALVQLTRRRGPAFWSTLGAVVLALNLVGGFLLKKQCVDQPWADDFQYKAYCYNDIQVLYIAKDLATHAIPYVEHRVYEYPTVMGLQLWLTSLLAQSHGQFFLVNAPFLALWAFLAFFFLLKQAPPRRVLIVFAASPAIFFYAFYNLDMLAALPLIIALWAWTRGRLALCGALLGIGASTKLFPGFALPALLAHEFLSQKPAVLSRRNRALRLALSFFAVLALLNVPVMIADYWRNGSIDGWLGIFRFHADRLPDFGTFWHWLPALWAVDFPSFDALSPSFKKFVDLFSLVAFAGGTLAVLVRKWRLDRGGQAERIEAIASAGATIAIFLLVAKVHSPQYILWILPFFVIVPTSPRLIATYFASDVLVFMAGNLGAAHDPRLAADVWTSLTVLAIFVRAGVLCFLIRDYGWRRRAS